MGKGKKRFKNKGKAWDNRETNEKGVTKHYPDIIRENANFEKYYRMQNICPDEEFDQMMAMCRQSLPASFRITGSRSEAKAMLHIVENCLIKDIIEVGKSEDQQVEIKPFALPWYPGKTAWQINLTRNDIRRNEAYARFHNFLVWETESGNTSRQEAVSMIPPLALKVEPHHKVLDMCASPGSKTAQIIEMLHAEDSKPPEGYVIANDMDNKRCYMLVHQGKRLQSPAFVVTNHDASQFPELFYTGADGEKTPLKFDRVLCDVPCSGDGTIRKNIDIWKKWNCANSLSLQQVQYQILKRGMELLATNGLLVYSTCSLNPLEDEAVVCRMLKEAKGSVELMDIDLPHLKYLKGLSHWKVCDRDLNVYEKLEDVPQKWATTIHSGAFPPSPEEAPSLHLDKCLRILPHQQDTGGFFVALLRKTESLPWEASLTMNSESGSDLNNVDKSSSTSSDPPPAKKPKRMQGYKEDPYIFMSDDHEIWEDIKKFYSLDESMKSVNFIRRTEGGKIKNLYLTTDGVRNFVMSNDKSVKIVNVGVKALVRIDNKWSKCNFRLSQEGLPSLCSSIKGRRLHITKKDLMVMLEQTEEDKAPLLEQFTEKTQEAIKDMEGGSLVLICDFPIEGNGPRCYLELVGWKGAVSLRVYVQKSDRTHYLRLCGMPIPKYGVEKSSRQTPINGKEEANGVTENNGNPKDVKIDPVAGVGTDVILD
ncbi:RNA cytosine-C(5)-methyltransferase NSUN2 isoform X2 [Folsomia candida]|uniref:RNA cytosine-C(5)-methyltransferase NSUN2 isoform X2 n=1 Tax=Folsomia candida TaxID=158441 RepID=UPI000B8F446D|nr:RNA cytosine-C(5)-methyltransferase NSUN2 isoform X2 [Folsomia candida]